MVDIAPAHLDPESPFGQAADRVLFGADALVEASDLVAAMTTDEKLACLDGDLPYWPGVMDLMAGGYHRHPFPAAAVERLGVPGLHFADGPRGCVIGPCTAFPVAMARGASFDPELEQRVGDAIGGELRRQGATYTGAICMNLLHHPAWGRAQETYGEDPHHVGEMAAAFAVGLQHHVMACMKHFALNSMENARFQVDVTADERVLHEVYLPHFRRVAEAGVASVMSAYNSVNGDWCGENRTLLVDILRDEWGWDGFVITDFIFGLRDPVGSVPAGCNIEMPFQQQRVTALADALEDGSLAMADVDQRVTETVATLLRFAYVHEERPDRDGDPIELAGLKHNQLAWQAAVESMVLLRNDGDLLPVAREDASRVAVLGRLADEPNLGDGGSSNVLQPEVVTALDGVRHIYADAEVVHSADDASIADGADLVVVVVGYTAADEGEFIGSSAQAAMADHMPPTDHPVAGFPPDYESPEFGADAATEGFAEGGDRTSLRLSPDDEALIAAAREHSDRVVVVVIGGSAVVMPWADEVPAVLMAWYPGMQGGHALGVVLAGGAEPGGRLPFAIPAAETDLPPFDKDATEVTYDLLHGQWHLDETGVAARFPFGAGQGYTRITLDGAERTGDQVSATVTNRGARPGSTVVLTYGAVPSSRHRRPVRRLLGFKKVHVDAAASQTALIDLDLRLLDVRVDGVWVREDEPVVLSVGLDAATTIPVP